MKRAIIIGYKGQDGTYLKDKLIKENYEIIGVGKDDLYASFDIATEPVDIIDPEKVNGLIQKTAADEIYYLAAYHHSSEDSLDNEAEIFQKSFSVHVMGLLNFLEAIRKYSPQTRLFYAASSHIFGSPEKSPQNEQTPYQPECAYGITKTAGLRLCQYYRREHNVFASVGIFYNHESPLRPPKFISRRVVDTAIAIKKGRENELVVGNFDAKIDWGYAPDYVEGMHRVMQLDKPSEFIISSGELHTLREFIEGVFSSLGLDWRRYVKEDSSMIKKKQKRNLFGDNSRIKAKTHWQPKTNFKQLIENMINDNCYA